MTEQREGWTSVNFPPNIKKGLRRACAEEEKTQNGLINRIVEDYLGKHGYLDDPPNKRGKTKS